MGRTSPGAQEAGAAQYDLDVFINSKWIRKVKASEEQIILEVTKYLVPGPNKVLFAATKHVETGRKSASAGAYLKVIIGEGEAGGSNVLIDNPLLECKRTAAETDNVNEEFRGSQIPRLASPHIRGSLLRCVRDGRKDSVFSPLGPMALSYPPEPSPGLSAISQTHLSPLA